MFAISAKTVRQPRKSDELDTTFDPGWAASCSRGRGFTRVVSSSDGGLMGRIRLETEGRGACRLRHVLLLKTPFSW